MKTLKNLTKSYKELSLIDNYIERYNYLKLDGVLGAETFGFDRWVNQRFYKTDEWKRLRESIILRDDGNDMGADGYPIKGKILIHHINPISLDDIVNKKSLVLDPDNLVCVSLLTHNAIHYGNDELMKDKILIERKPYDTCPWRLS